MTDGNIQEKYLVSQAVGKDLFGQITEQGVNPGLCSIAGLEIAALSLEEGKANHDARVGSVAMFAHRVLEGKFPNPREHISEVCLICIKMQEIAQ